MISRILIIVLLGLFTSFNSAAGNLLIDLSIIKKAELISYNGEKTVELPFEINLREYPDKGGRVVFRMSIEAETLPPKPVGIFIPKISLSGRLFVNGNLVRACDSGNLENLRCLHKPVFFVVPSSLWRVGVNTIELEIYANRRQANGLSEVYIGESDALYNYHYRWTYWLRNDFLVGLTWLSTLMGLISLSVAIIMRTERVYLWFGFWSISHSFYTFNNFVSRPVIDVDLFFWIVVVARMVAAPMGLLTYLSVFDKFRPIMVKVTVAYLLLAPIVFWLSGLNRTVSTILLAPFIFIALIVYIRSFAWLLESPTTLKIASFVSITLMIAAGILDLFRLAGESSFVGTYYGPYANGGMLFTIGTILIRDLAGSLIQSRHERAELERRAEERMAYEVTENIPVGTFTFLQNPGEKMGRFVFLSRRFLKLTGLNNEKMISDFIFFINLIHPDDKIKCKKAIFKANETTGHFSTLVRLKVGDDCRWISIEAVPRILPNGSRLWEGVLVDETDRIHYHEENNRIQAALQMQLIQQSRVEEREQLLRDMHDGFGSQLASVRMMAEKGRIRPEQFPEYLHELSADLHLVVDTMSHQDASLDDALVDFRYRLERRISGERDTALHWAISLDGMPRYTPREILHLLRLLQESVNNVLKHASARNIWITAQYDAVVGELLLSVRDDGKGLPQVLKKGRGLNNMRYRAREIGGDLEIVNSNPGVEVRFMTKRLSTPLPISQ